MIKATALTAAAIGLCVCCTPANATGLTNRVWVSGHGTDAAGCGAPTAPCRSFQYAVSNVIAPGGEIDVLDPAGYGAVTITQAISIVNDGVGTAGVQASSGNAITINAGANDAVTLRGLNIDGLGLASNGIAFNAGGGLTVVNCVIRHFPNSGSGFTTGNGILIQPTSGSMTFLVSNLIATDNGLYGVSFRPASGTPSATGVLDHVIATNDQYGMGVVTTAGSVVSVAIANSVASNNSQSGIVAIDSAAGETVSIDNTTVSGNASDGISALFVPNVLIGRSVIMSNAGAGVRNSTPNTIYTYGNNSINLNGGGDVSSPLNTTFKLQ